MSWASLAVWTSCWGKLIGEGIVASGGSLSKGLRSMANGQGVIRGHLITLHRFLLTFWRDFRKGKGFSRRGGGHLLVDLFSKPNRGSEPTVQQDFKTDGLFTVEYPDERLPVYERFRVLPMLVYDTEDGNVRCTSCNICA